MRQSLRCLVVVAMVSLVGATLPAEAQEGENDLGLALSLIHI